MRAVRKVFSLRSVSARTIPLCTAVATLIGCTTLQPTASADAFKGEQDQRLACRAPHSKALSVVAGLCVAAGQAAGAAITGDFSQGGAAVMTLGTVVMNTQEPMCASAAMSSHE